MLVPGASGVYLYAYCVFYYTVNLDITGTVPKMVRGVVVCALKTF